MKNSVLIVENEFSIALDIKSCLESSNYKVTGIAANYNNAIELLNQQTPSIVLLDINLGGKKSGIDLAIFIRKNYNLPIIFLTAYSDDKTFQSAISGNPMAFLSKPFNDIELIRSVFYKK